MVWCSLVFLVVCACLPGNEGNWDERAKDGGGWMDICVVDEIISEENDWIQVVCRRLSQSDWVDRQAGRVGGCKTEIRRDMEIMGVQRSER